MLFNFDWSARRRFHAASSGAACLAENLSAIIAPLSMFLTQQKRFALPSVFTIFRYFFGLSMPV